MDEKLKKQAIDLFVAHYGVTPEKFGHPVIDVYQEKKEFLFGRNREVIEARLIELKLQSFFEKAYWVPIFLIVITGLQVVFMFLFQWYRPYFRDGLLFLIFLLLCWGGVLYFQWLKLQEAREKCQEGLMEIFY